MKSLTHRKYAHLFFTEFALEGRRLELGVFTDWGSYFLTCYDREADEFTHLESFNTKAEAKKRLRDVFKKDFVAAKEQEIYNPSFAY